ncbi:MAG: putative toxin-antitoxin system toxin component, PIN family [Nanoarchaeota archaeon]
MKVTLDTNILLSATFWEGDPFKIIEKIEDGEIELVLSEEIIEEFSEVLEYKEIQDKIISKNLEIKWAVEEIVALSKIVDPQRKINIVKDDEDDNKIIECALEGICDYIITRDKHLLKLKEFEGIKIVAPEDFMKLVS